MFENHWTTSVRAHHGFPAAPRSFDVVREAPNSPAGEDRQSMFTLAVALAAPLLVAIAAAVEAAGPAV